MNAMRYVLIKYVSKCIPDLKQWMEWSILINDPNDPQVWGNVETVLNPIQIFRQAWKCVAIWYDRMIRMGFLLFKCFSKRKTDMLKCNEWDDSDWKHYSRWFPDDLQVISRC